MKGGGGGEGWRRGENIFLEAVVERLKQPAGPSHSSLFSAVGVLQCACGALWCAVEKVEIRQV